MLRPLALTFLAMMGRGPREALGASSSFRSEPKTPI
jgi:hypothetical protein